MIVLGIFDRYWLGLPLREFEGIIVEGIDGIKEGPSENNIVGVADGLFDG